MKNDEEQKSEYGKAEIGEIKLEKTGNKEKELNRAKNN